MGFSQPLRAFFGALLVPAVFLVQPTQRSYECEKGTRIVERSACRMTRPTRSRCSTHSTWPGFRLLLQLLRLLLLRRRAV